MRVANVDNNSRCTFQRRSEVNYGVATQAARRLRDVGVLSLTPTVYASFLSVLSARSQVIAERLKALGLPEKITPRILVKRYGNVFTLKGLVDGCVRDISNSCINAGLDPRDTKIFSFLRQKGISKPPILSILHSEDSLVKKVWQDEPLSPKALEGKARAAANWKEVEDSVKTFFAERGEKVAW